MTSFCRRPIVAVFVVIVYYSWYLLVTCRSAFYVFWWFQVIFQASTSSRLQLQHWRITIRFDHFAKIIFIVDISN